jgi:hypothetical protein
MNVMTDGSAQCVAAYHVPDIELEGKATIARWNEIPWVRVIVDTLLVAGILLASANFLSVR